ncbi:SRPBCC family protein [Flavobacterium psychrotolerans]|uniref:Transcriptional regulator n=1 Tax=Flavobacterium psychrotolerans TaxID=2169410 RepID=A0A2U1JQY3_9FLAO|nr:GyrI-like domain-containing protein [Flavobacterium psychrotolerans]PWA07384.1 transcriptional regulator [Flavobacterium psychrotolerans]
MRILKYIFLLVVLALFATTVFVATQKGDFDVERSALIKSPKSTVFNYVNDYRNWETFGSWKKDDPEMEFYYPINTIGNGASYSWNGSEGSGEMKTIAVKGNESIHQKTDFSGTISDVYWTFKDTVGGTKVTWRSKGSMGFSFKIYSAFKGGANKVIGTTYEKSLANLDKTLDYELKTYTIKVNGIVKKLGGFYLQQTINSKISNVPKNLRIMIPKMIHFFKKNHLVMYGKPFVLYHTFDTAKGITKFSVCVPIKDEIFISEGSDITAGQLVPFKAVKTTLKGDYSHLKEAWKKTFEYIAKNNLAQNTEGSSLELYSKSIEQVANPSQWVTEIYIPIRSKIAVVYKPKPITVVPAVVTEQPAPATTPDPIP